MSRTFTNLLTHLIFSTKDREPLIRTDMRDELHAYLGGLARELKGKAYGINGTDDYVHMLSIFQLRSRFRTQCASSSPIHLRGPATSGRGYSHGSLVTAHSA